MTYDSDLLLMTVDYHRNVQLLLKLFFPYLNMSWVLFFSDKTMHAQLRLPTNDAAYQY